MNGLAVKKEIKSICKETFNDLLSVKKINQGYYGFVFFIEKSKEPKKVIAKVYKAEGLMHKEHIQLDFLRKYALTKVPQIYAESTKAENGLCDIMLMEYINGINGSEIKNISKHEKDILAEQIVDNLIAIHSVKNTDGFGELCSDNFLYSWNEYYKATIRERVNDLHKKAGFFFPNEIIRTAEILFDNFDKVFTKDVTDARLIHGDYNMWNLMVDPDTKRLVGMIDPMGCSWADSELDLFQLQNANGDDFGLLDCYIKKVGTDSNIHIKNGYYGFFDDVKHWILSGNLDKNHIMNYAKKTLEFLK